MFGGRATGTFSASSASHQLFLGMVCLLAGLAATPDATEALDGLDATTQTLLVEAVEAASALDLLYSRCRGDLSERRTENLNKLVATKFRLTVLTVKDELFPEQDYRRAQQRLEQDFATLLQDVGGCQGAKTSGLPETLRVRYDAALNAIRSLP